MKRRPEDERFADWVDDRLDDAARAQLEAEFELDPELREAAEGYRRTVDAVRAALAGGSRPRVGFADRVLARAVADEQPRPAVGGAPVSRRWLPWAGSFAAAAALVLAFLWVSEFARRTVPAEVSTASHDGLRDSADLVDARRGEREVYRPSTFGGVAEQGAGTEARAARLKEDGFRPPVDASRASGFTAAAPTAPQAESAATGRDRGADAGRLLQEAEDDPAEHDPADDDLAAAVRKLGQTEESEFAEVREQLEVSLQSAEKARGGGGRAELYAADSEGRGPAGKAGETQGVTRMFRLDGPRMPVAGSLVYVLELPEVATVTPGRGDEGLARRAREQKDVESGIESQVGAKSFSYYARGFVEQPLVASGSWTDNVMPPRLLSLDTEAVQLAFVSVPAGAQPRGVAPVTTTVSPQPVTGGGGEGLGSDTAAEGRFVPRPGDVAFWLVGDPSQQDAYLRRLLTAVRAARGRATVQRAEMVIEAARAALPVERSAPESDVLLVLRELTEKGGR